MCIDTLTSAIAYEALTDFKTIEINYYMCRCVIASVRVDKTLVTVTEKAILASGYNITQVWEL